MGNAASVTDFWSVRGLFCFATRSVEIHDEKMRRLSEGTLYVLCLIDGRNAAPYFLGRVTGVHCSRGKEDWCPVRAGRCCVGGIGEWPDKLTIVAIEDIDAADGMKIVPND